MATMSNTWLGVCKVEMEDSMASVMMKREASGCFLIRVWLTSDQSCRQMIISMLALPASHSWHILSPSATNTLCSLRYFCCVNERMYLICAFDNMNCKAIL